MSGEAILFSPAVGLAILRVLTLLLLPVLPLAAIGQTFRWPATPREGWRRLDAILGALLLSVAAVGCGVLFAPDLLYASSIADLLRFDAIFPAAGDPAPWQLGFADFLRDRALPLLAAPLDLAQLVIDGEAPPDVARSAMLLAAVAALLVFGPLLRRPAPAQRHAGLREGLRNLLLVFWGAYATIYTVALVLWLASLLNFWCFLVLFALSLLLRD